MRFIQIINNKKSILISIFLFTYIILNLFDGERGLISYYKKIGIKNDLLKEQVEIENKINLIKKENSLLSENVDLDYLEILYREKFLVGKPKEEIFTILK